MFIAKMIDRLGFLRGCAVFCRPTIQQNLGNFLMTVFRNIFSFCLSILVLVSAQSIASDIKELEWSDLVPKDQVQKIPSIEEIGHAMAGPQTINAPVVKELDGKTVKIPGFVVPLEGDDELVTEFLLVPYFGACVHVPPPPSNQIIHVTFKKGAKAASMYDPIWVTGKIATETWTGDLAQVGYTMEGVEIAPYDDF